jgi:hypothetical protein
MSYCLYTCKSLSYRTQSGVAAGAEKNKMERARLTYLLGLLLGAANPCLSRKLKERL